MATSRLPRSSIPSARPAPEGESGAGALPADLRPRSASRAANSSSTRPGAASTQSPSLSLTAASAAAMVTPWPTEVAGQRRSGGNSAGSIARLRPIPITAQSGGRASSRTPAALLSPIQTSFGHFTRHSSEASASTASQTASGTASGRRACSRPSGRRIAE